jgi:HlyD family secretion protein
VTRSEFRHWGLGRHLGLGFAAVAVLVLALGGWAAFTQIAGAVVASGQVVVEGNRQVVQHPTGGVISEILVRDGDTVEEGEVVLRLEGDALRTELAIVEGQFFEFLARKDRLSAERDGFDAIVFDPELRARAETDPGMAALIASQELQFATRAHALAEETRQLGERKAQIVRQIEGLDSQLVATRTQAELIAREVSAQETLFAQGLTEQTRLLSPQREAARLQGVGGQVEAAIAESRGRIAEIEIEILRLTTELREEAITELRDVEYRVIELRARRERLREDIARLDLRAPAGGVVYGSTFDTLRAVVRPAEPILYIVPRDADLIVRARVETINVDEVHVGQVATLRFSAFDMRTTPEVQGTVDFVSADAVVDERTGMAFYDVDVRIDRDGRAALGDRTPLPGMPVEVFIRTGDRTPLSYLTEPLTGYFNRAFREG